MKYLHCNELDSNWPFGHLSIILLFYFIFKRRIRRKKKQQSPSIALTLLEHEHYIFCL
jgi:hypothetical protein